MQVAPERARHADDERTHGKRGQFCVHGSNADHGSRDVHVADRHPLAPDGAAHQVLGEQCEDHDNRQHKKVLGLRALQGNAQETQRRDRDRARRRIIGEELDAQEGPVDEELRRQRRHREIEPADAQAGDSEHHADHGGKTPAEQNLDQQRQPGKAHAEIPRRIGAHRHEGTRAQRNLSAVPDQDVQADRGQRQDEERRQDRLEKIVARDQRHDHEGHQQQQPDENAILPDREDLLVRTVRCLELSVFTIKHGVFR